MVSSFIKNNWKNTIRYTAKNNGKLIALPYPYTVPSVSDTFQEMYYWDTYFINKGLILSNMADMALNNTNNALYLLEHFGYMPNGNNVDLLNRSQPPFLSLMVRDVYEYYQDDKWLINAYKALKKEYMFWTKERITEIGLSSYKGTVNTEDDTSAYASMYRRRTGCKLENEDDKKLYRHSLAVFESGWDITPRWKIDAYNYAQVELNSLLYAFENNMALFSSVVLACETNEWIRRKNKRAVLMRKYMTNRDLYYDYNLETKNTEAYFTAAAYFPMFVGCASESEAKAAEANLKLIECEHGLAACEKKYDDGNYQWNYPNAWAPLTYIIVKGLLNYGYTDSALRLAEKYINTIDKIFKRTENLWEKYNAKTGDIDAVEEYGTPPMLGWTAGVYLLCKGFLKGNDI